jgi:CPA2 family monovalent cation:H+ antiporter-2
MGLNAALIAALFVSIAFIAKNPPGWLRQLRLDEGTINSALWLAAVILSLPLLIATFRKLQALGLLVAELKVSPAAAGERTAAIRAVIAHLIPGAGIVALGLYVLALSSAVLPPLKVLVLLLIVVGLVTGLLWRSFIKIYARAQVALQQTFAQPSPTRHEPVPLPGILRDADLDTVSVATASAAAGRLIRELRLRTATGASIVGIERNGASIINPGPDEELQAGDRVLLLGNRAQLDAARELFEKPGTSTDL